MAKRGRESFEPTEKQRGQVEAMIRYGVPEQEIAKAIGIHRSTLARRFRDEIDTATTKANAQVGEFIFSTIIGMPIPNRPPVTDERARVALAIFWAKTRMRWSERHQNGGDAQPYGDGATGIEIAVRLVRPQPREDDEMLTINGHAEDMSDG